MTIDSCDDFEIEGDDIYSKDEVKPSENWDNSDPLNMKLKDGLVVINGTNNLPYVETKKNLEEWKKELSKEIITATSAEVIVNKLLIKNPIYYDNSKIFWIWDSEKYVWVISDDIDTIVKARSFFEIPGLNRIKNDVIDFIKIIGRENKPIFPSTNWIQFGKTIYNLENGETFDASPKYFFTNSIPFTPSISDDTPTLDLLFDSWVGRDNRELLYEIIAYCSYRDYPIHHLFCLVGSGSNGKSKFLKIIEKFVGIENCTSTSLDTLLNSRFESSNLYKKLVCSMGETNFGNLSKTDMLKRLTGQDLVSFEFKGKNPIADYNYAKILISTNTLPQTTDRTDGFYRRWVLLDFPNKFTGEFDILKTIPEVEYSNLARKVLNILPNLLSYMRFTNVGTLDQRKKAYEDKSNPLPKFLESSIVHDVDSVIFKWEFNERFNAYLKQNNLRSQSDVEIGMSMKSLDFIDKKVMSNEGKSYRVWEGIKWRDLVFSPAEESILNAKPL